MTLSSTFVSDANASDLIPGFMAKAAQSADSRAGAKGFDHYLQAKEKSLSNNQTQTSRKPPQKTDNTKRATADDRPTRDKQPKEAAKSPEPSTENKPSVVRDRRDAEDRFDEKAAVDEKIVETVAETLDVPVETVIQWLAELQLQPMDLTDHQAVTALLQKAFGASEPVMLLTEPAFPAAFDAINEAMAALQSLSDAANVSDVSAQWQGLTVITDEANEMVVVTNTTAAGQTTADTNGLDGLADRLTPEAAPEATPTAQLTTQQAAQQQSSADIGGHMAQNNPLIEAMDQEMGTQPIMPSGMTFESAAARVMGATGAHTASPVDATSVMEQIMSRVRMQSGDQFAELKITLRPENLGDVTLRVVTLNGIVTAQFIAENQRVKEVLESNFTQLRNMLQQQGVHISELSVSVGQEDNGERMNQFLRAQQSGRRRIQRMANQAIEAEAVTAIEDNQMVDPSEVLLNSVDFTA